MKKILTSFILIVVFGISNAQYIDVVKYTGAMGDEDWTRLWTDYKPSSNEYYNTNVELSGTISKNTVLSRRNTYLLKGMVYVCENAVLTIEPGTIIRGDASTCGTLVITRGSKIIAEGKDTDPIIFTSNASQNGRSAGDWGGIIILGNAPVNKIGGVGILDWGLENKYAYYGGPNEHDDSGILKYVRIEYPGHKISKTVELNGLTLAGVGKKTNIENIQISYSNDDSFELFGGSVYLKNIVSYKCADDDFDFNYGYNGRVQFAIAIRHPFINDFSGSRCIEAESYSGNINTMDATKRFTNFSIANMVLITLDAPGATNSHAREAIYVGPDCCVSVYNSVISGFQSAFVFKDDKIKDKAFKNEIRISGNIFNDCDKTFSSELFQNEINTYYFNTAFRNRNSHVTLKNLFTDPDNAAHYDFRLKAQEIAKSETDTKPKGKK